VADTGFGQQAAFQLKHSFGKKQSEKELSFGILKGQDQQMANILLKEAKDEDFELQLAMVVLERSGFSSDNDCPSENCIDNWDGECYQVSKLVDRNGRGLKASDLSLSGYGISLENQTLSQPEFDINASSSSSFS